MLWVTVRLLNPELMKNWWNRMGCTKRCSQIRQNTIKHKRSPNLKWFWRPLLYPVIPILMNNLTPVEVEFINACISKIYKQKILLTLRTSRILKVLCVSVLIAIQSILLRTDTSDLMATRDTCARTAVLPSVPQRIHSSLIAGVLMIPGQNSLPVS